MKENNKRDVKGQIWVSAVLYMLIGTIIIVLILQAGLPIIQKNKDNAMFSKSRETFVHIDNVISELIQEGVGSQRIVTVEIPDGRITLHDNALKWEMQSDSMIIQPGSESRIGNVRVLSDVDVSAITTESHFSMQNTNVIVNITRVDRDQPMHFINTTELITSFFVKSTGKELAEDGKFSFILDNNPSTETGYGYTVMQPGGNISNSNFARVLVYMHATPDPSNSALNYTLSFTIGARSDFIQIDVPEYRRAY